MKIELSSRPRGAVGVCGHAGVGHVHSHSGFVQDDSGGFAAAVGLLKAALPADTVISSVEGDLLTGVITVRTAGGGVGRAEARRGITPHERELLSRAVGRDGAFTQAAAFASFGRIYGQGVLEAPVALQAAAALAVVDTFRKNHPGVVKTAREDVPGNIGEMAGAVLDIGGVPTGVLAVVNATGGGLGPNEDLEGNVVLGEKGGLMEALGIADAPTIVVEGKAYVPGVCDSLTENTFFIRHNREADNQVVALCLTEAAEKLGLPFAASDGAFPRGAAALEKGTRELGEKIAALGRRLSEARRSREKVRIVGELALLVSQDAGGVTFMTDPLQDVVGSAGMTPGLSAVISLIVTTDYIRRWKIPELEAEDTGKIVRIIAGAVPRLAERLEEARAEIRAKSRYRESDFAGLLSAAPGGAER